jgi:hypothetical protein
MAKNNYATDFAISNLKLIRSLSTLSQNDFGLRVGASKDQVNSYESGKAKIPKPVAMMVAQLAGVSENDFLNSDLSEENNAKQILDLLSVIPKKSDNPMNHDLKELVANMKIVIESQNRMIETQNTMIKVLLSNKSIL